VLQLSARWAQRTATAAEVAARIVHFAQALAAWDPLFARLAIARGAHPVALDGAATDLPRVLAALESSEHVYAGGAAFGPESRLATGFSLPLVHADPRSDAERAIALQITDGGDDAFGAANHLTLSLPQLQPVLPGEGVGEAIKALLRSVVVCWRPQRMWLLDRDWRRVARLADCDLVVGWLTWLDRPTEVVPPLPAAWQVEPMEGGTLVVLSAALPDPADRAQVERAQEIARLLAGAAG
jgi:Immunity protein 52